VSTALVTGATGFVGRRLASTLAAEGIAVHALVRDPARAPAGISAVPIPATAQELIDVVAQIRPDVAFHLATYFVGAHKPTDVEPLVAANVLFGAQLAEALAATPPRVLVNVGTAWQHDESGGYNPAALYAATKQAMEDILRYYAGAGAFKVANVKLFDTYGPDDTRGKLLSILDRASRTGQALEMSPGEQLIDLVHVDDAVAALRAAADAATEPWSSWSAASGTPLPLKALVERFATLTRRPVPVHWGARPYRQREMFAPWPAGPRVPGWTPRISLDDGIRSIWCP
jgi:nucleoside-diphosphate-sugar epimerase